MKSFKTFLFVAITMIAFLLTAKLSIHYGRINLVLIQGFIIYLIIVNLYGFFIMLLDKIKSSEPSNRRISERHLFISSAIGGALGTLLGMKIGRHKTKHLQFKIILPVILIIEVFFIVYFLFS